jgi:hypothetical protein
VAALSVTLAASAARAQPPAVGPPPSEETPKIVRIALSTAASRSLGEGRLRRLVEIQLGGAVTVPAEPAGALDENAVRVFVDLPQPTVVSVQVQGPGRRIDARRVDVAGLPWDVATRYVAIAASESVRAQLASPIRRKPRAPTDDEIRDALASKPSFELSGGLVGAFATDADVGLFGSRVRATFHQPVLSETFTLSALGGTTRGSYFELGVGAAHRVWITSDVRARFGLGLGIASGSHLRREDDDTHVWVRGHAITALDLRFASDVSWLSIGLEPGVLFDAHTERAGFMLGGTLEIGYDAPY